MDQVPHSKSGEENRSTTDLIEDDAAMQATQSEDQTLIDECQVQKHVMNPTAFGASRGSEGRTLPKDLLKEKSEALDELVKGAEKFLELLRISRNVTNAALSDWDNLNGTGQIRAWRLSEGLSAATYSSIVEEYEHLEQERAEACKCRTCESTSDHIVDFVDGVWADVEDKIARFCGRYCLEQAETSVQQKGCPEDDTVPSSDQ